MPARKTVHPIAHPRDSGKSVMALMIACDDHPGHRARPNVAVEQPALFWDHRLDVDGNLMLVVLNLPLIGLWVKLLKIPISCSYRSSWPSARSGLQRQLQRLRPLAVAFFAWSVYLPPEAALRTGAACSSASCSAPCSRKNLRRAMILRAATRRPSSPGRSVRPCSSSPSPCSSSSSCRASKKKREQVFSRRIEPDRSGAPGAWPMRPLTDREIDR